MPNTPDDTKKTPVTPGSFAVPPVPRDLDSLASNIESLWVNINQLHQRTMDHEQRFDTLQTPWWKRLLFLLDGWPWYDLNAPRRRWRPWHGLLPDRLIERLD
jgi:hypothetical protein